MNNYFILNQEIPKEILKYFLVRGNVILSDKVDELYYPVNTHPDVQITFINNELAVCAPEVYRYYTQILPKNVNLLCGISSIKGGYPMDSSYNGIVIGKNFICNEKYIDKILLNALISNQFNIINTNQGYAKCNTCKVSDNAIVTEDYSIYKNAIINNIDVCLIEKGGVRLKGFEYGFIGGASFLLDDDVLFFGDIKKHPEYLKIKDFADKYNKNLISLSDNELTDYGSLIFLKI